jgi:hypothetical protein
MNNIRSVIAAALITILIGHSCKTPKQATLAAVPEPPAITDTITDLSSKKPIKNKELYAATTDMVPLDTAYLNKDTLHILTKKINACEADKFQLMWNGMMAKSLPPQASIKLFLLNEGTCKEMHHFHLTFNVTPLRFKQDSIRTDTLQTKTTIIKLGGLKQNMFYNF